MSQGASTLSVRVTAKTVEAVDICSFELAAVDGAPLPSFAAGSHVDVDVGDGLTRQYSLCNPPSESHRYQIAVLRDAASRGGSVALHDRVQVGDTLRLSPPKNHFALVHGARRSVLLAGGIGVTPLLCMAERLAVLGAEFELHYCTRSPERTAFRQRIAGSGFAARVHHHFDDGPAAQRLDVAALLETPADGTHVYVCGPTGFIESALAHARAAGWPEAQLHCEYFGADVGPDAGDRGFQVRLASSGRLIDVPKDRTVVEALEAHGIVVAMSCEQGVCGTCLTRVIEGVPDHRDLFLTPEEQAANDQFTPCCSRSKSAVLVLDL